jgi:uncharacterized membrane protein YciS (DUF1049 family)
VIRWTTLKGATSAIVFFVLAVLAELVVVLYAIDLGVQDANLVTINWPVIFTISPLLHVVPIAVIITLLFTWMYLAKKLSVRPLQPIGRTEISGRRKVEMKQQVSKASQPPKSLLGETKQVPARTRGASSIWQKTYSARVPIKSAFIVFLAFFVLVLIVSLLTYPALLYQTLTGAYQSHSSPYGFIVSIANLLKGFAQAVSPISWLATTINNGLVAISPGIRSVGLALGSAIAPLANLDPAGKYLAFQNAAAWISVLLILFYGQYSRRSYRYRKK